MKVFISHSWQDKTVTDRLARDLQKMADVWFDTWNLKPGDRMQEVIDKEIADTDVFVLMWSFYAADSKNVGAEIETAIRHGKKIIPCLLGDKTPLPQGLEGILAVEFDPYELGYGRLCSVILSHQGDDLGVDTEKELKSFTEVGQIQNYILNYEKKKKPADHDEADWLKQMNNSVSEVFDQATRLKDRVQSTNEYVRQLYDRLGVANDDPAKLQDILHDVIRHEHLDPRIMQQVREIVERALRKAQSNQTEFTVPPAQTATGKFGIAKTDAETETRNELKRWLNGKMPLNLLDDAVEQLAYYINSMHDTLEILMQISAATQSPAMTQVIHQLVAYLDDPNDLLPESQYGVWGYLDDAWLIHNVAYRLVESGIIAPNIGSIAWDRISYADQITVACLPQMVRYELENYLNQMLTVISAEVSGYVPQFVYGENTYHPFMGQAAAAGGMGDTYEMTGELIDAGLAGASLDYWSA